MKILIHPDKILYKVAMTVLPSEDVDDVIKKMIATVKWHNGAGLAAPQIGVSKRIICFVLRGSRDFYLTLINPMITYASGKIKTKEGCLSVPNIQRDIKRYRTIEVWGNDCGEGFERVRFNLKNMDAVVVQHEMDHLNGITILDGAKKRKLSMRNLSPPKRTAAGV